MKFHALNLKTLLIGFSIFVSFLLVNKVHAQCLWTLDGSDIYYLGKIGVGSTDPQTGIHLDGGSDYNASTITIQRNNNGWGGSLKFLSVKSGPVNNNVGIGAIAFHSSVTASSTASGANISAITTETWSETGNGTALRFFTKQNGTTTYTSVPQLFINHDGKIGIGTINPSSTLTVNGDILAQKVQIIEDVPASDFVFEKDYNLISLEELETYINNNKHLPEIPSAEEFKENGYGVGEMDDLLLRKVEELTLYIIEQNKLLKEQSDKITKLETENTEIKMMLESN